MKPFSWELQRVVESRKRISIVNKLFLVESTEKIPQSHHKHQHIHTNTFMIKHTDNRAGMKEGKYTDRDE